MKLIPLRDGAKFKSADVFRGVLEGSVSALPLAELRARWRVLDALDAASGEKIVLEDAEWETLKRAMEGAGWATADRGLRPIIDDVLEAKEPAPAADEDSRK